MHHHETHADQGTCPRTQSSPEPLWSFPSTSSCSILPPPAPNRVSPPRMADLRTEHNRLTKKMVLGGKQGSPGPYWAPDNNLPSPRGLQNPQPWCRLIKLCWVNSRTNTINSPQAVGHIHQVLQLTRGDAWGPHSQFLTVTRSGYITGRSGFWARPLTQAQRRADLRKMSSQEPSGLMRITVSHFGIRTVFSKEIIWLVFPVKKSFSRLPTGQRKCGL